jgi:hypothetical protein
MPTITRPGARRLWNVFGAVYVATFPIMGGALVSSAIGDLSPRDLVIVVALMLLVWGITDLWDGYAGFRNQILRSRKVVHQGAAAQRRSITKVIAGIAALCLSVIGFLL